MSPMHLRHLFVFLIVCGLWPLGAHAEMSPGAYARARASFAAAERGKWAVARSEAAASENAALITLITWRYALDSDSRASFHDITRFMTDYPHWPEQKKLRLRAELALKDTSVEDSELMSWFEQNPPLTGIGKMALAEAMQRQGSTDNARIDALIRDAWRTGDFEESREKSILQRYGALLSPEDHAARIDRLLWEEKTKPAERLMTRAPKDHQKLFAARIAFIKNKKTALVQWVQVPSVLKKDPGLIYDRMRSRVMRNNERGVRESLLDAPMQVAYPDKWWKIREPEVRQAIDERNYSMANRLLANHGQTEGVGLADALWLQGWLKLEFLNEPQAAAELFARMYDTVRFPVSRARAAYWAGRAEEKQNGGGRGWYEKAAAYPTAFYGQLAAIKLNGNAPLDLPTQPDLSSGSQARLDEADLAQAIRLSAELGAHELAGKLMSGMMENAQSEEEAAHIAALGQRMGLPFLSVRAAKKIQQQKSMTLSETGYPRPVTPENITLERALALAITRQESEFDSRAKSPANALGMMQLLPKTAKEMARKNKMSFSPGRLYDDHYNWTIGSIYLSRLIESYGGSYVMAIAAYNAGPGNVRKWVHAFGTPGNDMENAINWIEKIPFAETRNYVHRVLENLQVYRHLESEGRSQPLMLADDLVR